MVVLSSLFLYIEHRALPPHISYSAINQLEHGQVVYDNGHFLAIRVTITPVLQVEERNYLVNKEKSLGGSIVGKVVFLFVFIACEKRMI